MTNTLSEQELQELREIALQVLDGKKNKSGSKDIVSSAGEREQAPIAQDVRVVRIKRQAASLRAPRKTSPQKRRISKANTAKAVEENIASTPPIFEVEEVADAPQRTSKTSKRNHSSSYIVFFFIFIVIILFVWLIMYRTW